MTSHPSSQLGQSNMSSHPSITCHQRAPIPVMEVQSTAIPAKRGPEDDVQFVSVHPVKKARGSRETPPAPAQIQQQTPDQNTAPPQAQNQDSQAHGSQLSQPGATSGPESELSMLSRGVSFPGLENYTFPSPPDSKPCQTSRSSPILSPRQLPQNMLPDHTQNSQDFRGFMQPPQFQVPWGMSALYPQPAPMNPEMPLSRTMPMPMPSVQAHNTSTTPAMDIDDQPLSMSMALRRPEPPRPSTPVSQSEVQSMQQHGQPEKTKVGSPGQQKEQVSVTRAQSNQGDRDQDQTKPLPYPSPRQEPRTLAKTPSHAQTRAPTPNVTQPQAQLPADMAINNRDSATGPDRPASQQTAPPKGPCVVCEQIRQQILFNQANGLPVSHLPQLSHGWHGQGPVAQVPMGHPNAAAFGVMPNMLPNLQQRFQPISLGHLPMAFGMQHIPVQVQMQLQRQMQAQNVHGNESSQNNPSQNQQGRHMQGQQTSSQVSQPATGQQAQYMHSQLPATLSQSVMMQRPMMTHQQTLATPSPPSPQPSPQTTQTTSTPTPTLPPAPAPALPEPKKQHSPNLIVDIAETCEELFPWDEVAKRHGVTRVKVVDTFGAIIQLPLLRCTTDKKRHGKLATSRLREYTKAKKDAEANSAASAAKPPTPVSTPPPTSAAPVAQGQSQVAQLQASQLSANQAQTQQLRQVQLMQAQAMQAQAMQAQATQMYASQGHINQTQPHSQPSQQLPESQDRSGLPGVFEISNTFSPLGLPSNLTNGLSGHWQQQHPQ